MKKAAIAIDGWKLPIFDRCLSSAGYAYTNFLIPNGDTILLTVETDNLVALEVVVRVANAEARATGKDLS